MKTTKPLTPSNALIRLQDLCARSEQCSHEILTKLRTWGISDSTAQKILALLRRDRFVNDSRYAGAFVRDKIVFNRWGRSKIKLNLIHKHIDRDIIDEAMESIDPEEYRQALVDVLRAKSASLPETTSFESRNKLLRHAASRGFEVSVIIDMLKHPEQWQPDA